MAVGWVDAMGRRWINDEQIDFGALENEWRLKTFETGGGQMDSEGNMGVKNKLLCCLTGFEDRTSVSDMLLPHCQAWANDGLQQRSAR